MTEAAQPDDYQKVEILLGGRWVRATFMKADMIWSPKMEEEVWWLDQFVTEEGDVIEWPREWRPLPEAPRAS